MSLLEAPAASPQRVCFGDIQRFLGLFAEGLAGNFIHLKLFETKPGERAGRISTDGDSIYLPPFMADFATAEQNLGAYRIAVLHQIGYFVEGTFDFDPAKLAPPPERGTIPPTRKDSALESFFATAHRPALLRRIFRIVEDLRIDIALRRRYPGARADLDRVLAHALARRAGTGAMRPLSAMIEALVQYSLGAPREALLAQSNGALDSLLNEAATVEKEGAGVHDSARAALRICAELERMLRRASRSPVGGRDDETFRDPDSSEAAEFELVDSGSPMVEFRGELIPERFDKLRGGPFARAGRKILSPAMAVQKHEAAAAENAEPVLPRIAAASSRPPASDGPRSFLYDEWDYHGQSYLSGWCRVYEHTLRGDDFEYIHDVRRRHATLANRVRHQFARIKPHSWRRVHRTIDGDELELDAIIDALIDRQAGRTADSHLYLRRDRALRDVAAAFLVDMSASTDFHVPDPATIPVAMATAPAQAPDSGLYLYGSHDEPGDAISAPRRRVIDVSKDALALMCDALQTLGDNFAIYGFSGDGRDNVEFHVAKEFGNPLSARTWAALAAMQPRRSTRMGPAIRHALTKLAREPAGVKVLIIISDGYPEDHDYGADRNDREYGIQDTARALREAEGAGVVDFCVTIDPAGNDYLRRMCAPSRYLVIDEVAALPRELTKVYRTLTSI
jgi:nitric oxide reductase NorD protein